MNLNLKEQHAPTQSARWLHGSLQDDRPGGSVSSRRARPIRSGLAASLKHRNYPKPVLL